MHAIEIYMVLLWTIGMLDGADAEVTCESFVCLWFLVCEILVFELSHVQDILLLVLDMQE